MSFYPRPVYGEPGTKSVELWSPYTPHIPYVLPQPDYPIAPVENFKLAAAHKTPVWMPNLVLDFQLLHMADVLEGLVIFPWESKEAVVYKDEFGCQWKYVVSAGGAMMDPDGTAVLDDITKWDKIVKFPEIKYNDSDFLEKSYDPAKVFVMDVFQGATERLVSLLGGYAEGMLAMAEEPEACADFFGAFVEWEKEMIDKLFEKYPIDMINYHDDFGTERDTFFSEKMMEELVLEPTRQIVQHVKEKGALLEFHSCGNIGRFMKYFVDMGVDIAQIQMRANDIPAIKRQYGDKIGFCITDDRISRLAHATPNRLEAAREIVDLYGRKGGAYVRTFISEPEVAWEVVNEIYCYSREYYDRERGE